MPSRAPNGAVAEPAHDEHALTVRNLTVRYGGVRAVEGVRIEASQGTCVAVIGANGAGKTSLLRGISGLVGVERGCEISIDGTRVERLPPDKRARHGLGHVLEGRHVFPTLSVRENLEMGAALTGGTRAECDAEIARVLDYFPLLPALLTKTAGSLSGGQQQFLAIARATVARPRVLLLDEPSVGLAPQLVEQLTATIPQIVRTGITVLLIEQALSVVQGSAGTVHLMSQGRIVESLQGTDPELVSRAHEVYLR